MSARLEAARRLLCLADLYNDRAAVRRYADEYRQRTESFEYIAGLWQIPMDEADRIASEAHYAAGWCDCRWTRSNRAVMLEAAALILSGDYVRGGGLRSGVTCRRCGE